MLVNTLSSHSRSRAFPISMILAALLILQTACAGKPEPTPKQPEESMEETPTMTPASGETLTPAVTEIQDWLALPENEWQKLAPMRKPRTEMPAILLDGIVYVPGGYNQATMGSDDFEAYDITQNTWTGLKSLPADLDHLMGTTFDGKIYIFGGNTVMEDEIRSNRYYRYDPKTDAWTALGEMPYRNSEAFAVATSEYIYILGGRGRELIRYDPSGDSWDFLAPMQFERNHLGAVELDGKIYAIGGRDLNHVATNTVEVYDPETDTWTMGPAMQEAHGALYVTVLNGKIYTMGGEDVPESRVISSVEIYDPERGTWSYGPQMPYGLHGGGAVSYEGNIYLLGGSNVAGVASNPGWVLAIKPR